MAHKSAGVGGNCASSHAPPAFQTRPAGPSPPSPRKSKATERMTKKTSKPMMNERTEVSKVVVVYRGGAGRRGLDPLVDGVPGNAAGEEGWEDTTGDAATDAATFEDGSADALADEDVEATDSARGDEGATDAITFENGSADALADEDEATDSATRDEAERYIT